jgi:sugar lactone lactonase YvrE
MLLRTSLVLGLLLATASAAAAQGATETWRLGGLQMPESVILDKANGRLIVGNMATFGADAGPDGYLTAVSPDGKLTNEQWATGLEDPKGMAIVGDKLYVADNGGLVEISLADGKVLQTIALEGAVSPNDVTTDGTAIYVSDLAGSAIYKVTDGKAEQWLKDEKLATPNGLEVDGNTLIVGSMGTGMHPDFTFDTKGGLQQVDLESKAITAPEGAMGISLTDGVAKLGGDVIFDDNPAGTINSYSGGTVTILATLSPGSADLWVEGNVIYVPLTQTGELVALRVR